MVQTVVKHEIKTDEKRKIKGVSFNLEDPEEKKLYDYANSVNFSSLMKRLLFMYKVGIMQPIEDLPRPKRESKEIVYGNIPSSDPDSNNGKPISIQTTDIKNSGLPFD